MERRRVDVPHAALRQLLQRRRERQHRPPELRHLPLELVDALRVVVLVAAGEDLGLDLVDVVVDERDRLLVAVDHQVGGPVQHPRRAVAHGLGVAGVELRAHPAQDVAVAVADGHDERRPEEDGDLADVHDLLVVDVGDRLEDHEHDVVVDLQLGTLVRLDRVLDGQGRQVEVARDGGDVVRRRLLQPDPDEAVGAPGGLGGVGHGHPARPAPAGLVHRAVGDDVVQRPGPTGLLLHGARRDRRGAAAARGRPVRCRPAPLARRRRGRVAIGSSTPRAVPTRHRSRLWSLSTRAPPRFEHVAPDRPSGI